MFSGIIEEIGRITTIQKRGSGARLKVSARIVTNGTREGDSIAVNGVCLTALNLSDSSFEADVSRETIERTTLNSLKASSVVNLERALTPSTRMGGHIVQGHVDTTGRFLEAVELGGSWTVKIGFPQSIAPYLVAKGSIAVEGISLTIAALYDTHFEIAVIPKTWSSTNLSHLSPQSPVNLEADVIAKYVERLLTFYNGTNQGSKDSDLLKKLGDGGYL
jgi:riboflavin synthase